MVRKSEISRFRHNLHTLICSITRVTAVCGSKKKKMYRVTLSSFYVSQPGYSSAFSGEERLRGRGWEILLSSTSVFFR